MFATRARFYSLSHVLNTRFQAILLEDSSDFNMNFSREFKLVLQVTLVSKIAFFTIFWEPDFIAMAKSENFSAATAKRRTQI